MSFWIAFVNFLPSTRVALPWIGCTLVRSTSFTKTMPLRGCISIKMESDAGSCLAWGNHCSFLERSRSFPWLINVATLGHMLDFRDILPICGFSRIIWQLILCAHRTRACACAILLACVREGLAHTHSTISDVVNLCVTVLYPAQFCTRPWDVLCPKGVLHMLTWYLREKDAMIY